MSIFRVILVRIFPHSDWILRISPYSVQMRKNADHNNSEYRRFSRSDSVAYWIECSIVHSAEVVHLKKSPHQEIKRNFGILRSILLFLQNVTLPQKKHVKNWQKMKILLAKSKHHWYQYQWVKLSGSGNL